MKLYVDENKYSAETVDEWQQVWKSICEMAYCQTYVFEEIITKPHISEKDDNRIYRNHPSELTLDFIWKQYSNHYGTQMPFVIPMLKRLHVPRVLFEEIGVYSWFKYSFPNCKITFWEE